MVKKSRRKLIIIDPINGDYKSVLESLIDENNFIKTPSRVMNITYSEKSKIKVEKQIQTHFDFIDKALVRNENDLAMHKLNEVVELKNLVKQADVNERIDLIGKGIIKKYNQEFEKFIKTFNNKIEENETIKEHDVEEYKKYLKKSQDSSKTLQGISSQSSSNKCDELKDNLKSSLILF